MKSLLWVPGDRLDRCEAALDAGADALVVTLSGTRLSPFARRLLDRWRRCASRPQLSILVSPLSGSIDRDLDLVMAVAPDSILLPGAAGGTDIQHLAAKLAVHEAECGLADGATHIIALAADTARGVLALGTIANASPRLASLGWRAEMASDEAASLNAPDRLARALTLVAAAAAEVDAIEAISPRPDLDALARDCEIARRDGFAAKFAVDAAHIPIINAA